MSAVSEGVSPENVQAWWFALYASAAQYIEKNRAARMSVAEELNASTFADAVLCASCGWVSDNMLYSAVLPPGEGYCTAFHCAGCFARRFRDDITKPVLTVRLDRSSADVMLTLWAYRTAYLKQAAETPETAPVDSAGGFTF